MVIYAEELKDAEKSSRRFKVAASKYALGLVVLEEMRHYWHASAWAHSMFTFLSDHDFLVLRKLPRPSRWHSPETSPVPGQSLGYMGDITDEYPLLNDELLLDISMNLDDAQFLNSIFLDL
jgi:hypothetical protein